MAPAAYQNVTNLSFFVTCDLWKNVKMKAKSTFLLPVGYQKLENYYAVWVGKMTKNTQQNKHGIKWKLMILYQHSSKYFTLPSTKKRVKCPVFLASTPYQNVTLFCVFRTWNRTKNVRLWKMSQISLPATLSKCHTFSLFCYLYILPILYEKKKKIENKKRDQKRNKRDIIRIFYL